MYVDMSQLVQVSTVSVQLPVTTSGALSSSAL